MFCRNCGENIPVDSVFCPNCGKNLLEIGAPTVRREEPLATKPESEPMFRRRRSAPIVEEDPPDEELVEDEWQPRRQSIDWSVFDRIGFPRLFWVMGLLFAVVGFVIGLAGRGQTAIIWILFGIALLLATPLAPSSSHPTDEIEPDKVEPGEIENTDVKPEEVSN